MNTTGKQLRQEFQYEFNLMWITAHLSNLSQLIPVWEKGKEGCVYLLLVCEEILVMKVKAFFEHPHIQSVSVILPCPPVSAVYFDSLTFIMNFFSFSS